jgi:gas vesicle protein
MCLRGEVGMNYQDWDTKDNAGSSGGFFSNMFFAGAAAGLIAGLLFAPQTRKSYLEGILMSCDGKGLSVSKRKVFATSSLAHKRGT